MKQILQNLKTGEIKLEETPCPIAAPGRLLIRTTLSLISAGTERMIVDFGKSGYLTKARKQPEKVRQVIDKIKTDGLRPTIEAVMGKLDKPIPMGYCNVGRVIAVGEGVDGFAVGDRVVSNGPHAEVVLVPKNLCAKIPDGVDDDAAVFTVIGAIALQGVRLLAPSIGESVAVFGLGLTGLIAAQILKANGVKVIGFDNNTSRVKLAKVFGVKAMDISGGEDPVKAGWAFSKGRGLDGAIIAASTESDELISQAAGTLRKRGRIVLTGVTGLNLKRSDFYEKEISFQVSCSYGPGRYDEEYETHGRDYPFGFVRWTENRNFEAVLELLAGHAIETGSMITWRIPFDQAAKAYDSLIKGEGGIGIALEYPEVADDEQLAALTSRVITYPAAGGAGKEGPVVVGVIGAGDFTSARLLPALKSSKARLKWIASSLGSNAAISARKFSFEKSSTDYEAILADEEVNAVVVSTRNDSHAHMVIEALKAGKNVYVEKPLCISENQLEDIIKAYRAAHEGETRPRLMVGFNRRYAPLTEKAVKILKTRSAPLAMTFTCNAGHLPADHWHNDPETGGGRIITEACHFIDLLSYLAGAPVKSVAAAAPETGLADSAAIVVNMEDGSAGTINYFSNGPKNYPKEKLQVFWENQALELENFTSLAGYGTPGFRKKKTPQDKGHTASLEAFVKSIELGEPSPMSFESAINATRATFAVVRSIRERRTVEL